MKESDIQRSIIGYLQILENKGILYFFRSGSGSIRTEKGGFFKTGKSGCPDISVVIKGGQYVGIEVKTAKGKMSPAQKQTQAQITNLGGVYILVRSLEELQADFRGLGIQPLYYV